MIEARLLSVWDGLAGSAALIAIIVLAFCVMVGAVKAGDVPRHLGVIVGVVVLLIMLPAIIAGLWSTMSFGQHLEIVALGLMIAVLLGALRKGKRQRSGRTHRRD
jgi:hypothetical protein